MRMISAMGQVRNPRAAAMAPEGDDAGGALPDGEIIAQFLHGGPALFGHKLALKQGQHRVAPAEIDASDFQVCPVQLPQVLHTAHHAPSLPVLYQKERRKGNPKQERRSAG